MTLPILEYISPDAKAPRPLLSLFEKIVLIALGAVLPVICFSICAVWYPLEPEYQSHEWYRYIVFLPDGRAGFPFHPLLLYSIVCLCAFIFRPGTSKFLIVRLGLYTGIILSLQYTLIQASSTDKDLPLVVGVGLASNFILFGVVKGLERLPRKVLVYSAIGLAVVALLSAFVPMPRRGMRLGMLPVEAFLATGIACLVCAPVWSCGVYVRASLLAIKVNRNPQSPGVSPVGFLAWIPWLGVYAAAWKWSIHNAIVMYSKLPTSAPGCYIATAAAAGHPGFVGSARIHTADGKVFAANQQLRRLKCVELALATICPAAHQAVRKIYNRLGPPVAGVIAKRPLLADLMHVMLRPVEWGTFGILIAIVPEIRQTVCQLYTDRLPAIVD